MNETPECIGIILDGNRRWAKERGLPSIEGHRRGVSNIESIVRAARDMAIRHVVVYVFSTENWDRSKEEVSYLMEIFESATRERLAKLNHEGVAVRFVGQKERFPQALQNAMHEVEEKNPETPKITLWVCLSYGGRAEIVAAARAVHESNEAMTEQSLAKHLWTAGMPDPDLIIRTGDTRRISNFLLWQGAYSEIFFVKTYWPEFTKADLEMVLKEYATRERRIGR